MSHPALVPGAVAVVTGGASGIGLASALRFAAMGLKVCVADLGADKLGAAADALAAVAPGGAEDVLAAEASAARPEDMARLEAEHRRRLGRGRRADEQCRRAAGQRDVRAESTPGSGCWTSTSGARSTARRSSCPA